MEAVDRENQLWRRNIEISTLRLRDESKKHPLENGAELELQTELHILYVYNKYIIVNILRLYNSALWRRSSWFESMRVSHFL